MLRKLNLWLMYHPTWSLLYTGVVYMVLPAVVLFTLAWWFFGG